MALVYTILYITDLLWLVGKYGFNGLGGFRFTFSSVYVVIEGKYIIEGNSM